MEQRCLPLFGRSGGQLRCLTTTGRLLAFLGVILMLLPVSCLASLPPYWYDPPCQANFSWTTSSGRIQSSEFVAVEFGVTDQGVKYCQNPLAALPDSDDEARYPPAVQNVQLSYYRTEFKYSNADYGSWAGFYGAINMTFQLGHRATGKVSGVLFSMEGLSPDFSLDFRQLFCRAYRFVPPLTSDALLGPNNESMQFFFDCFRGQQPGMLYEYTLRTLPVTDTSIAHPRDNVVKYRYRSPSCYSVPEERACRQETWEPPADIALCSHWKPQFFTVSAHYRHLTIVMEIGPEDCGFNSYRMAVSSLQNATRGNWGKDVLNIHADDWSKHKTFAYERNITYIKIDFKGVDVGQRVVMVNPTPSPNSCFLDNNSPRPCSTTLSAIVNVIENPCVAHPCSAFEICEALEHEFVCVCKPGYIRMGYVCILNPCEVSSGNVTSNPCEPGSCIVTAPATYHCNCTHGFFFNGRSCIVDECLSASCAPHGTCTYPALSSSDSTSQASFTCDCAMGYQFNASNMSCQVSTGILVTVSVTSLGLAVSLLLLLVICRRRRQASPHTLWKAVRCWSDGGSQSDVQQMQIPSECSNQWQMSSECSYQWQMPSECSNQWQMPSECSNQWQMSDLEATSNLECSQEESTKKTDVFHLMQRITVLLLPTHGDHPLHDNAVEKLAIFLQEQCMCDVIFPAWCWMDIQRTGLNMWLANVLHGVNKVIVLCSKGTRTHWQAPGPDDVLGHALPLILADREHLPSPSDKYAVAHLDYSSRDHVPPPLCVSAVFCLMRHMDQLFFRLHGLRQNSAESSLRAHELEEGRYAQTSQEGAELHAAIQLMHSFQREDPDWYARFHSAAPQQGHSVTAQGHSVTQQGHSVTAQGHSVMAQGHNDTPQGHSVTAQGHSVTPQGQSVTPQGHSVTAQGHNDTPQGHSVTAQGHSVTPQGHSVIPQGQSVTPQGQSVTPLGHNDKPQGHNVTPQGHNDTPQGHSVTPQGHNDKPQGLNVTSHGHNDTPQGHSVTPQGHSVTPLGSLALHTLLTKPDQPDSDKEFDSALTEFLNTQVHSEV